MAASGVDFTLPHNRHFRRAVELPHPLFLCKTDRMKSHTSDKRDEQVGTESVARIVSLIRSELGSHIVFRLIILSPDSRPFLGPIDSLVSLGIILPIKSSVQP